MDPMEAKELEKLKINDQKEEIDMIFYDLEV